MKKMVSICLVLLMLAELGILMPMAQQETDVHYEQNYNTWVTGTVASGVNNGDGSIIYNGGVQAVAEFPTAEDKSYSFTKATDETGATVQYTIPVAIGSEIAQQKQTVVEFDFYNEALSGNLYIDVRAQNTKCSCLVIDTTGMISFSSRDQNISTQERVFRPKNWYNIKFLMNWETEKTSLYINDEILFDNHDFNLAYFNAALATYAMDRVVFSLSGASAEEAITYYVNNMKIFSIVETNVNTEVSGYIIGSVPTNGAENVNPDEPIAILFDRAIDRTTLHSGTIKVLDENGLEQTYTGRYDELQNRYMMHKRWEENVSYTILIDGVLDLYGNAFGGIETFTFTTGKRPEQMEFFVEQGCIGGDGSYNNPFGSFEEARNHIRWLKNNDSFPANGVTVNFREGIYPVTESLSLGDADSGTQQGPVIYQAYQKEQVKFIGGTYFNPAMGDEVSSEKALSRIDDSVVSNIRQISLEKLGLTAEDFGEIDLRGSGSEFLFTMGYTNRTPYADLYYGNERMVLARWPNKTEENPYTTVVSVTDAGTNSSVLDMEAARGMTFTTEVPTEKLTKWTNAEDAWLHGFWYYDWSDSSTQIASIDAETQTLVTKHPSATTVRAGQRFYAYNLLEELDEPGEWYLDKENGNLFVYPPGEGEILISTFTGTLLSVNDASDIQIKGIDFKGTRGNGVSMRNCTRVGMEDALVSCTANYGVNIANSAASYLKDSEVCSTGGPAASISGGELETLTPGGSYIDNCHIHNFAERNLTNNPGIHISGVGNTLSHNEIHEGPHQAIKFNGNDNIIEYNNIYHVCKEADDAAAIYTYLGVVKRGNIIRHNYIHDMKSNSTASGSIGIYGVYNDGGMCGNIIVSNVFENIAGSGGAVMTGSRDHTVANNIVVNCRSVVRVTGGGLYNRGGLTEEEYAEKYPYNAAEHGLTETILSSTAYDKYPHLKTIADDEPYVSKYNVVRNNIIYYNGFGNNTANRLDVAFSHTPSNSGMLTEANPTDADNPRTITVAELFPEATAEELAAIETAMEEDGNYLAKEFIRRRNFFADSAVYKSANEGGPGSTENPGFADAENGDYTVVAGSVLEAYFTVPSAEPTFETLAFKNEAPDFANMGLRDEADLQVTGVSVYDAEGNRVLHLTEEINNIHITAQFSCKEGIEQEAILLVGLYDENGVLLQSDFTTGTITQNDLQLSVRDFNIGSNRNAYVKCYLWEGFGNLMPLDISYRY